MKYAISFLLYAVMVLFPSLHNGQARASNAIPYSLVGHGYLDVLYNSATGLPGSEANDIIQTDDGFIWIASYSGLFRYDGKMFRRMDSRIANVMDLMLDSEGRLWIGTNDNGIAIYKDGIYTFLTEKDGLSSNVIRAMCETNEGDIIIGTTGGLCTIQKNGNIVRESHPRLNSIYIAEITPTQNGFAGLTKRGDFFASEFGSITHFISVGDFEATPTSVRETSDGSFLLGTNKNKILEVRLNPEGFTVTKTLETGPLGTINAANNGPNGELWVCSDNGVGFFDAQGTFHIFQDIKANNSIEHMMVDYEGNIWLVSSRQGVLKITRNRFLNVSVAANMPETVVNAVNTFQGRLYVATDNGLRIIENDALVETPLTEVLDGIRIRHLMRDTDQNLWISTYSRFGLLRVEKNGEVLSLGQKKGMPSERIRSSLQLANGEIVAATRNGLAFLHDGKVIATLEDHDGLINPEILTLCEASDGTLYAGSDGGGVYTIRDHKVTGVFDRKKGLLSSVILRIKEQPNTGNIWILTGNSIAVLSQGTISTLPFPCSNTYDLFFPDDGSLWILGSQGVFITTSEKILSGKTQPVRYGISDGLPSTITANSFSSLEPDGKLLLCSRRGVSSIDIHNHSMSRVNCRLAIPSLIVDGKPQFFTNGRVSIPSSSRRISIEGYALTYSLNNPLISCRLEGFDETPLIMNRSMLREQTYTNLKGGDYVFRMAVLNPQTRESIKENTVVIHKELTFWEYPGAFFFPALLVLVVLLLGCRIFLHWRTRALIRKQKQTRQFLRELIRAFARTIDIKDKYTNGHSLRVACYSKALAEELGLKKNQTDAIHTMAMLHDIGKIIIPDDVLRKPGALTKEEYDLIKTHAATGGDILSEITSFPDLHLGARYHHERFDGSGYSEGLRGEKIPFAARIIAVADTFDAMNSTRPYRCKLSHECILSELTENHGQLDPQIVEAMLRLLDKTNWFSNEEWRTLIEHTEFHLEPTSQPA